jgi:hypothetical protein
MATRRDKVNEVFVELINMQLKPHGKTYDDVKGDPDWYMRYNTTREHEQSFMKEGTELIRKRLHLNKKMAEMEMSWFILQWGLTTNEAFESIEKEVEVLSKSNKAKK